MAMSANSLEHYGVKGMKWDKSKRKKTQKDYASTSFWDISPVELPAWRKAQQEKKNRFLEAFLYSAAYAKEEIRTFHFN